MPRSSRKSARNGTIGLHERPQADFRRNDDTTSTIDASALDYAPFQSLITAAILAATAFRLRDQEGLTEALRRLVQAVQPFEVDPKEE